MISGCAGIFKVSRGGAGHDTRGA
ncbi:MAG: hypothetical protein JWL81_286, partial [Verrucomicrobiales bacterium]|nr:hypothetical protein [Verrucomicrobiales bacterium]